MSTCGPALQCVGVFVRVCVQEKQTDSGVPEEHAGGEDGGDHHQQAEVRNCIHLDLFRLGEVHNVQTLEQQHQKE